MIKLVLADMDNTLVPFGRSRVSEQTIAAIHACQAEGITFAPASGRSLSETTTFLANDEPSYETAVLVNGQQVYLDGKLLSEITLDPQALARAGGLVRNMPHCALLAFRPDGFCDWVGDTRENLLPLIDNAVMNGGSRVDALPDYPVTKAGIITPVDQEEKLALRRQLEKLCPELDFLITATNWFDIVTHGWSKLKGVEVLEGALGLTPDELCAFGDAENDLEMFAHVTHSCAVANATPAASSAARWHVGAAEDDGVAIALEQLAEAARLTRETGREVLPAFMRTDLESPMARDGSQDDDDLFGQIVDATKIAISGAGDAYRESFQEFQEKLPAFDEILAQAIRLPGTSVSRAGYLAEVIGARHTPNVVEASITQTPAAAGLTPRQIEKIAKKSLGRDWRHTTALSFAAGIPGGVAGAVTIPADLIQFYGYLIRAIQKLTYLYGWRDLVHIEADEPDLAASNGLIIMLGVMAGIAEADDALARLARLRKVGASDQALRNALAERGMSAQVNQISDALTKRMARRLTGQVAGKAIPVVGGIVSGVITGSGFDEMSRRLMKQLKVHGAS